MFSAFTQLSDDWSQGTRGDLERVYRYATNFLLRPDPEILQLRDGQLHLSLNAQYDENLRGLLSHSVSYKAHREVYGPPAISICSEWCSKLQPIFCFPFSCTGTVPTLPFFWKVGVQIWVDEPLPIFSMHQVSV